MSATGDGAAHYMATAGTITALVSVYSYSFWYKATHVPTTGAGTTNPMGIDAGGGSTYDVGMTWDNPSASFYQSFAHLQAAGGAARTQIVGTPAANVWNHFVVTWDGTNLLVYLNGVLNNSSTGSNPPNVNPNVTALAYSSGASGFDDGSMGELTIWNVTLTAAQAASLGTGALATTIENANIVFYSTLNTDDPGQIGPVLTNHSCVINTSWFQSSDGGLSLGGSQTTTKAAYGWIMSGGMAIGGSQMLTTASYSFIMTGGLAVGGSAMLTTAAYNWPMSGGLMIGGAMLTQTAYTITMSGGLAIGSDSPVIHATANGGVSLAGRSGAFTTK